MILGFSDCTNIDNTKAYHRYEFIHSREGKWPAKVMCRILEVGESGCYRYLKNLSKPDRG